MVIPLKDRATIDRTIRTLLPATGLREVVVVDAGSTDRHCLAALDRSLSSSVVSVLRHPIEHFSRARLLNAGLQRSSTDIVLVSDADIEWSVEALELLLHSARRTGGFAIVENVDETDPSPIPATGSRLSFEVSRDTGKCVVHVVETPIATVATRTGPGLVCAPRAAWFAVGGYNTFFNGWGWEDQDLLMRAQLLGFSVTSAGQVRHISHEHTLRNPLGGAVGLARTRDNNARLALSAIKDGRIHGPLAPGHLQAQHVSVVVNAPRNLLQR